MLIKEESVKSLKAVTVPTFKVAENVPFYFRATGKMYKGKALKEMDKETGKEILKKPADLLPIYSFEAETSGNIVAGSILKENLIDAYPNDTYVGKSFRVLKHKAADGKAYKKWDIQEIADPAPNLK